ncbi:MAG: thiopeptide-type bacteriocin biosynthesis protein [Minicystis sp.]
MYLPQRLRTANVSVRPAVRGHEIPVGLQPGLTAAESIPLRELIVGLKEDRFYVRWPGAGKEVRVASGHMLNAALSPDVCRFLSDISLEGAQLLSGFSWGKAESFPYLPRVRSGRVVLRPAEWKIDVSCREQFFPETGRAAFAAGLDCWRQAWAVPRHVFLTFADNRLLLDLTSAEQAEELRMEIARLTDGARIVLQEVIPALDELWVSGPDGSFYNEVCVSLVHRAPGNRAAATPQVDGAPPAKASSLPVGPRDCLFPPGSEWTYLKLYAGPGLHDGLLAGPVRDLAQRLLGEGLADRWFFIRYTDPDHHLRLRFRCVEPERRQALFAELCGWATALMERGHCRHFAFDTYDREVERYGGPEAMLVAEQIFGLDSSSVVDHLALLQRHREIEPRDLVVATTDNLIFGLEPQEAEVIRWLRNRRGDKQLSGPEFRKRQAILQSYVAPRDGETSLPSGIRSALDRAREQIRPMATELDDSATPRAALAAGGPAALALRPHALQPDDRRQPGRGAAHARAALPDPGGDCPHRSGTAALGAVHPPPRRTTETSPSMPLSGTAARVAVRPAASTASRTPGDA